MPISLKTQLSLSIALIALLTVAAVSALANISIRRQFERHVAERERTRAEAVADTLGHQYDELSQEWDTDFIHGVGMYALYDGYIVKVYDKDGAAVWDAENHDMSLCEHIVSDISGRMDARRPDVNGGFAARTYPLTADGAVIGAVEISYYGPYFLSGGDFRFLDALNAALVAIGAAATAAAVAAGWLLARRTALPVARAAETAKRISGGDYGVRIESGAGTREARDLTEAVNHLAETLGEQERLRRRLVMDIAHELRTPVAAAGAHIEAMMEGVWASDKETLGSVYEELGRLGTLIGGLGRLARTESESETLNKTEVCLLDIARAAASEAEPGARRKNIRLIVKGERAAVTGDRDKLIGAVSNLLTNAVKYTPENGNVSVTVRDRGSSREITVEDDGIGIPEDDLPRVFERFYRVDKSRNRDTGGFGIGLAIVRSVALAHGGSVSASSEPGRGSRFTVTLPAV
ncbi:MAG: HAMP domain-containing histidine kinase [Oscillospiraceae bacterium]|jgi:signal transduction histidine kinase|nr:HAMP domain-containing histidine kinase [Oscillospiraceae bacterium]